MFLPLGVQGPSASQTTDAAALLAAGGGGGGGSAPPTAPALQAAALLAEVLREGDPSVLAGWSPYAASIGAAAAMFSLSADEAPKPGAHCVSWFLSRRVAMSRCLIQPSLQNCTRPALVQRLKLLK